jgi:hypothetical protein
MDMKSYFLSHHKYFLSIRLLSSRRRFLFFRLWSVGLLCCSLFFRDAVLLCSAGCSQQSAQSVPVRNRLLVGLHTANLRRLKRIF